ncbi:MAG: UTP--glucose-1-phosphate uridylyltransferase [Pseudomonadota bacterium]
MSMRVRKAVFPVAGLGTRFLPASKAIPKELVTVVDKPVLQYAVEEARAAGIESFIFVSSLGKGALEDHFDRNMELEAKLEAKGKTALLEAVRAAALPDGALQVVRQHAPLGLGHAVHCAAQVVGDEPFAVLLPDEVLVNDPPCLKEMVEAYADLGGALLATREVPRERTKSYGVLDPAEGADASGKVVAAKGMVEKPAPEAAPSTQAIIGRYILPPAIFPALAEGKTGAGGEIQLTDGIDALVGRAPVNGFRYDGARYDCGSMEGFLQANIALGLRRPDLAEGLKAFIRAELG